VGRIRSAGLLAAVAVVPWTMGGEAEADIEAVPVVATRPAASRRVELRDPGLSEEANHRIDYWIHRFQTDQRPTMEIFLAQEGAFGGLIRQKLRERGMPEEIIYLAMVESGLRPRAVSRVEAVGVWQFMGPTAEAYGLRVDSWVDERRDPVKATDAALDYLEWLMGRYGSLHVAAAAYNAGPTRVDRILRSTDLRGAEGDDVYWVIRTQLPLETREYVPRMLAAQALTRMWQNDELQNVEVQRKNPYRYHRVFVPGGTRLNQVADRLEVSREVIRALNPHLIQGVTPPGEMFPLRVPEGSAFDVVASLGGRAGGVRRTDD